MEITVDRKWKKAGYTIGRVFIDGEFFCNSCEDVDRELAQTMDPVIIRNKKIPNQTAIPTGKYKITLDVVSPKYSKYEYYMNVCQGKLPRLLDVPGFDGILIHVGTNANHSSGCILVGYNKIKGGLTDGKEVFKELYDRMLAAKIKGEEITIEIY